MTLPHSLFGAQVHAFNKRHWWQRHRLPKISRHGPQPVAELTAPPTSPDAFARTAPTPQPTRPSTPPPAPAAPQAVRGGRDTKAEATALRHFAEVGYEDAVYDLQDAHPSLVLRVADAACEAEDFEAARSLYELAHESAGAASRIPKHLQKRAERAAAQHNAAAQRAYLSAWMDTQPETFQALACGCLQACALNPALTRKWYLKARKMADTTNDSAGLECLSRSLLQSLAYAMLMEGAHANASLLSTLNTSDPQLLTWVANAARVAGNLTLADDLERRAQALSAGLTPSRDA